jgi:hypothetical protein
MILRCWQVVLVNGEAIRYGAGAQGGAWEAPPPRDRHPKGATPLNSARPLLLVKYHSLLMRMDRVHLPRVVTDIMANS